MTWSDKLELCLRNQFPIVKHGAENQLIEWWVEITDIWLMGGWLNYGLMGVSNDFVLRYVLWLEKGRHPDFSL